MRFQVKSGGRLNGEFCVPGDKSISHRSIMLGSLAEGDTQVDGFLQGEDSLATLNAFRAMGVQIDTASSGTVHIQGRGLHGLSAPQGKLDLGNSGTSMRLMAGLMAGQAFSSCLVGDESLSARPMNRVALPLRDMGAVIHTAEQGRPPLDIDACQGLRGIRYDLPVASAQIKSCLLLAGLYAEGETTVREPAPTRDHTERMLRSLAYEVHTDKPEGDASPVSDISLRGGGRLQGSQIQVPGDISSAAFFLVAASIVPGSDVLIRDVGINPTRTGVIQILQAMGADIDVHNERLWGAEPVADIRVRSAHLQGIEIDEALVPLAIDEFPVLFIAALAASGTTVLTGAAELRVKESDRIAAMADGISALGGVATATDDGMIIESSQLHGGQVDSLGDHRIAMAFAVAAMCASGDIEILRCANVATSFPGFAELAAGLGMQISEQA